jgi:mRNA-degrading endonuclease YafQ of YafQ-DinJ toxin-antitoxin module
MKVDFSKGFNNRLNEIRKKRPRLYKKILTRIRLFELDQDNRLLRLHKLKGKLDGCWAISAEDDCRLLFYYGGEGAVFFDLGTHGQVYRKK